MLKAQGCIAHFEFQIFHSKFRSQLLQPPTVDCGSRPEPPPVETCDSCTPMGKCPCPWGYFPDPHDCNQYVYCQVGYQFQHLFLAPTCEEIFFFDAREMALQANSTAPTLLLPASTTLRKFRFIRKGLHLMFD